MTKDEALKLALEAITQYLAESPEPSEEAVEGLCDAASVARKVLAQHDSVQAKPEPEQEPDKYMMDIECTKCGAKQSGILTVNTTPPQRKPLTDDEIGKILDDPNIAEKNQGNWLVLPYAYARAIEAAHGIKE